MHRDGWLFPGQHAMKSIGSRQLSCYLAQGRSIKAIYRDLRVSRKVVRKILRSEATEFRYEREGQPLPRTGPWQNELDRLLAANEAQSEAG